MQKQNDVIGFYLVAEDVQPTVGAFRAWLDVPHTGAKAFFFNDDATGINAIDNGELTIDNAAIYIRAGQRMNMMQRGVNIVNGRKVMK